MALTAGRSDITVGLVDGPIAMNHPDLTGDTIREVPGKMSGTCAKTNSAACLHGTFVAGILCAKRGSAAPAICPNCTLLAYPIFAETASGNTEMPSATPEDLIPGTCGPAFPLALTYEGHPVNFGIRTICSGCTPID
jgi:subtilisin family serine protease